MLTSRSGTRHYTALMVSKWFFFSSVVHFVLKNYFTHLIDYRLVVWPAFEKIYHKPIWNGYSDGFVGLMILLSVLITTYYYFRIILLVFQTSSKCAKLKRTEDKHLVYALRRNLALLLGAGFLSVVLTVIDAIFFRALFSNVYRLNVWASHTWLHTYPQYESAGYDQGWN